MKKKIINIIIQVLIAALTALGTALGTVSCSVDHAHLTGLLSFLG